MSLVGRLARGSRPGLGHGIARTVTVGEQTTAYCTCAWEATRADLEGAILAVDGHVSRAAKVRRGRR